MILLTAAFLSLLGFGAWILGTIFEYQGVAVIGGVIALGVGAMVTATDLRYQSGQATTQTLQFNETVTNETALIEKGQGSGNDYQYTSLTESALYQDSETVYLYNQSSGNATQLNASDYNISYPDGQVRPVESVATTEDEVLLVSYRYRLANPEVIATEKETQYTAVETPQRLPLGILWMLLAGVLTLRSLDTLSS